MRQQQHADRLRRLAAAAAPVPLTAPRLHLKRSQAEPAAAAMATMSRTPAGPPFKRAVPDDARNIAGAEGPTSAATRAPITNSNATARQTAYDKRWDKGMTFVGVTAYRARPGDASTTESGTVAAYHLPDVTKFPLTYRTPQSWSGYIGKAERYDVRWGGSSDLTALTWADLKETRIRPASASGSAAPLAVIADTDTHQCGLGQHQHLCVTRAFNALTGSTMSTTEMLSTFNRSIRRTDADPGLTINWMEVLQIHYASIPGHWMIRPITNDADLRLMLGGIGVIGSSRGGRANHTAHVQPPLSGRECVFSKGQVNPQLNGKYQQLPDQQHDRPAYRNTSRRGTFTLSWARHSGRWIITDTTARVVAIAQSDTTADGRCDKPGTEWLIGQSSNVARDPSLTVTSNRTTIDRGKFEALWGVLPAHNQAADNTIHMTDDANQLQSNAKAPNQPNDAMVVFQSTAAAEDDTPLHDQPALYRGTEGKRAQSITRWFQHNRVRDATASLRQLSQPTSSAGQPSHPGGTAQPFSMNTAAAGAALPACPERYWTVQLELHNPNQAMYDAQQSAAAASVGEIDEFDSPIGTNAQRDWHKYVEWDAACGFALIPSRTSIGEAIPYFGLNRLRGFAGYLLEWFGHANLNAYQSAINFYYQQHGYTRPWIGRRFNRFDIAYAAARATRARSNGEKGGGLREEISEVALEWMLSNVDRCPDPVKRGRLLIVLIMVLGFFRANTIGAFESEQDISFDRMGNLKIVMRALKGHKLAAPIIKTIVGVQAHVTEHRVRQGLPVHARAALFESIRKAKDDGVLLNLCLSSTTAKGEITDWFEPRRGENLLLPDIADLRDGGFHSSHSGRRTGASGAAASGTAFKEGIKPHGGWKTSASAERYVNDDYQVQKDGVVRQLFDFLPRNA